VGLSIHEAALLVERAEANAWEQMMSPPGSYAAAHGMRVWRVADGVGFSYSDPPLPFYNRFHGLGVLCPATTESLEEAVRPWHGTGRTYCLHAVPDDVCPGLTALLSSGGMSPGRAWVKVMRGPEPVAPVPTDLRVEEVGAERAAAFGEIAATAFGMPGMQLLWTSLVGRPGWHTYLAFDGSLPVAGGQLRVEDGVGWLGSGATLPSHRGRGAQGALMARRIADGITLGCRHLVTETGEDTPEAPNPSFRNMMRTGFRVVYGRRNWLATAPGPQVTVD
jgi:hypothetical protein